MTMNNKLSQRGLLGFIGVVVLLVACGDGQADEPLPVETSTTPTTSTTLLDATSPEPETTLPSVPPNNPNTAPQAVVDKAILDLVNRTGISHEDVTVVAAEAVTWPDGSLGCPEPGMSYTQALVDGSRVHLFSDGRLFIYHAGSNGEPFLCSSDEKDGGYDFVPPPGFDK